MAKNLSRPTIKLSLKTGRQRLPIAELEKLVGRAQKVSEHANAEVARFQALLDDEKHVHRMELGGQAILRRLIHLTEKTWSSLSGRLEGTLPEDSDHAHLVYWLQHRPKPEAEPHQPAEKMTGPAHPEAKLSAENPVEGSSQTGLPSGGQTGENSATAEPSASGPHAGQSNGESHP